MKKSSKSLQKQLTAQFYRGNIPMLCLAALGTLIVGSLNLFLSRIMQQLIDAASGLPGAPPLLLLAKLSAGLVLLGIAAFAIQSVSEPLFIRRAMQQYKERAFQKLTEKSIASFRDESVAAYLSALTNDASSIEADYLTQQFALIRKMAVFAGAIGLMLWYSPLMTAIATGLTLLPLVASLLTGGRIQAAERRVSDRSSDFTADLSDCLNGFAVVKTFQAEKEILRLFAQSNRALEGAKCQKRRLVLLVGMIGAITGIVAQLGVFLTGTYLAQAGYGLTPGIVVAFVNLMNFIIEPIAQLPGLLASRKAALALVGKLASSLEKQCDFGGTAKLSPLRRGIQLQNVCYSYDGKTDALRNVSAFFQAGGAYAVVGGSGSGKSTLLNLLMGTAGAYTGQILLDDTELRTVAPEALFQLVSLIQQNVFVFHASIRDNLTLFRNFPPQQIDAAIQQAHLTDLVAARGQDYLCGENGGGLSGGEKQRISIGRSLLKNASVLLADEMTAALDAQTAHQVTEDLLSLRGITRIVVTHRLEASLLRRYNGIVVLKDGHVAETGSFDELMAQKGYFYALYTVAQ